MAACAESNGVFGVGRVTRFYIPLLLQAFSQSLTYPLVAGIVTHGAYGVHALSAFTQGQMIMFLAGALGGGLVMTGLVFAKDRHGYLAFKRLNGLMMVVLLALQCVPALPPFGRWIFEGLFALPPELATIARRVLVAGVAMNGAFFLRNVPMVVLFNNFESGKANRATVARIVLTLACAWAFPKCGLTGPYWGLLALTVGCILEHVVTWCYARPYVRRLPTAHGAVKASSSWTQFLFTMPLSLGGFLLMISPLFVAAFIGRTAHAADMLAIHYVTLGVANPVAYAALRMQAVAIEFPPAFRGDRRLLRYAVAAGAALGLIPLAFSLPGLGDWYFGTYQNVPDLWRGTARLAIGCYAFICIIQAVRARAEGLAAIRKRPGAVMAGQIGYTVALFLTLFALMPFGVPGWTMAVLAIYAGPVGALCMIYATLAATSRRNPAAAVAQSKERIP